MSQNAINYQDVLINKTQDLFDLMHQSKKNQSHYQDLLMDFAKIQDGYQSDLVKLFTKYKILPFPEIDQIPIIPLLSYIQTFATCSNTFSEKLKKLIPFWENQRRTNSDRIKQVFQSYEKPKKLTDRLRQDVLDVRRKTKALCVELEDFRAQNVFSHGSDPKITKGIESNEKQIRKNHEEQQRLVSQCKEKERALTAVEKTLLPQLQQLDYQRLQMIASCNEQFIQAAKEFQNTFDTALEPVIQFQILANVDTATQRFVNKFKSEVQTCEVTTFQTVTAQFNENVKQDGSLSQIAKVNGSMGVHDKTPEPQQFQAGDQFGAMLGNFQPKPAAAQQPAQFKPAVPQQVAQTQKFALASSGQQQQAVPQARAQFAGIVPGAPGAKANPFGGAGQVSQKPGAGSIDLLLGNYQGANQQQKQPVQPPKLVQPVGAPRVNAMPPPKVQVSFNAPQAQQTQQQAIPQAPVSFKPKIVGPRPVTQIGQQNSVSVDPAVEQQGDQWAGQGQGQATADPWGQQADTQATNAWNQQQPERQKAADPWDQQQQPQQAAAADPYDAYAQADPYASNQQQGYDQQEYGYDQNQADPYAASAQQGYDQYGGYDANAAAGGYDAAGYDSNQGYNNYDPYQ